MSQPSPSSEDKPLLITLHGIESYERVNRQVASEPGPRSGRQPASGRRPRPGPLCLGTRTTEADETSPLPSSATAHPNGKKIWGCCVTVLLRHFCRAAVPGYLALENSPSFTLCDLRFRLWRSLDVITGDHRDDAIPPSSTPFFLFSSLAKSQAELRVQGLFTTKDLVATEEKGTSGKRTEAFSHSRCGFVAW